MEKFASGKVRARKYRNRRIGEFFKELDLSEKQGTGIPKILRELRRNSSPIPKFETDEDRTYLITTIRIHDGFENKKLNFNQKDERSLSEVLSEVLSKKDYDKVLPIIEYLEVNNSIKPKDAGVLLGKSAATVRRYMGILAKTGIVISEGNTNNLIYVVKQDLEPQGTKLS